MGKVLLGAGISGLIYAHYNRDCLIVAEKIRGKMANSNFNSIIYLHKTPYTDAFIESTKMPYTLKIVNIRYFIDGQYFDKVSPELKSRIIQKKSGSALTSGNLSVEANYITYYELDINKLFDRVFDGMNIIIDKVSSISDSFVTLSNGSRINYTELASTIPAEDFWRLYGKPRNFTTSYHTFVTVESLPDGLVLTENTFLYVTDDRYPFVRISSKENNKYLLEIPGEYNVRASELITSLGIIDTWIDSTFIINNDKPNVPPKNVIFLGRFAVHDYRYKQEDVIKEVLTSYDFKHMYNQQLTILNKLGELTERPSQESTKPKLQLYSVSLLEKLMAVVTNSGITYAKHEYSKQVIKVNIIKAFKYLIGIAIIVGIDAEEFLNLFNEESARALKKLGDE